jgi:ketosteroid isomerase-like protein
MKRIKTAMTAIIVLFVFWGCGTAIDLEKEKANLVQTDMDFSQASVEKGAAEAFKMYLAEDAIQLPTRANPIVGRDAIFENMSKNSGSYMLAWEPRDAVVAQSGDMGYTWGFYTMTYTDENGEVKKSPGKYLNIWKKQADGSWKVAVDMGN